MPEKIKALLEQIFRHLYEGDLLGAAERFVQLGNDYFPSEANMTILLSSRTHSLMRDIDQGILRDHDIELRRNQLVSAMNSTYRDMKKKFEAEYPGYKVVTSVSSTPITTVTNTTDDPPPASKKNEKNVKTILFLSANPEHSAGRNLDREIREIDERLKLSEDRKDYRLVSKRAIRVSDLRLALLQENPSIIHFSGSGTPEGKIVVESDRGIGKPLPIKAVAKLLGMFKDSLECVVLNACYSELQAKAIAEFIPFVVGMSDSISTRNLAIPFTSAFYDAIGAGRGVEFAFDLAVATTEFDEEGGDEVPVLHTKK